MSENYKWFFGFWITVVTAALLVTWEEAGWLNWLGNALWVTAVATALLAAGVGVALFGLADARRTRHAQILTDLSARWDDSETIASERLFEVVGQRSVLDFFQQLYEPRKATTTPDEVKAELATFEQRLTIQADLLVWPNLLETIGVLHATGIVTTDVVYRMWGYGVVSAWRRWAPVVDELRNGPRGHHATFRHFQALNDAMEKYATKLGEPFPPADRA